MRLSFLKASICITLFIAVSLLASCNRSFLPSMGEMFRNPFESVDDAALTQSIVIANTEKHRIVPSTTRLGKKELTLEECRRLALANSLELQQGQLEELTQKAIEYSNRTKMLPKFLYNGELNIRDDFSYGYSQFYPDGTGFQGDIPSKTNPAPKSAAADQRGDLSKWSAGRDLRVTRNIVEMRWGPTDAALAYYMTKSSRNDAKSKHYLRERTAQKLIGVVDSSFYRMLSLQKAVPMAQKLVSIRKEAASRMQTLFSQKLVSIEDLQKTDQKLLKAERQLLNLLNETEQQRNMLASAMYISPDASTDGGFCLKGEIKLPCIDHVGHLEMIAIQNRPEAYKAGLDHMNSQHDLKRTMVKYFPKATLFLRYTRDEDTHILFNEWKEIGVQIYFDLLDFVVNYWENQASKLINRKAYLEMGAVALAITSQVRTSAMKYMNSLDQLKTADQSLGMSEKVLSIQRERAAHDSVQKLQILESEGDLLNEEIEKTRTQGEAMGLYAELESSMGTNFREPMPR
ncbi:MAG: TolC family protein [Pseudomonadota bacterium]